MGLSRLGLDVLDGEISINGMKVYQQKCQALYNIICKGSSSRSKFVRSMFDEMVDKIVDVSTISTADDYYHIMVDLGNGKFIETMINIGIDETPISKHLITGSNEDILVLIIIYKDCISIKHGDYGDEDRKKERCSETDDVVKNNTISSVEVDDDTEIPVNTTITVEWMDSHSKTFEVTEFSYDSFFLWLNLVSGLTIQIPLQHVRWISSDNGDENISTWYDV